MEARKHKRRRLDVNRFVDMEADVSEDESDEPSDNDDVWLSFKGKLHTEECRTCPTLL